MNLTMVLRDVPIEGDSNYKLLYDLAPKRILYTIHFGGRPLSKRVLTELGKQAAERRIKIKLDAMKDVAPLNGVSEMSPVIPSTYFGSPVDGDRAGDVAAEAVRLFADIKYVYFDLGINPDAGLVAAMAAPFLKMIDGVKIGLIAPFVDFQGVSSLLDLAKSDQYFPCPFLPSDSPLGESLKVAFAVCGKNTHIFCSNIRKEDALRFGEITEPFPGETLVFWSSLAASDVIFTKPAVEEKPANDGKKEMSALFTSVIRKSPSLNAEMLGSVNIGEVVRVEVTKPDGDGTTYGKMEYGEGVGYVIVKHLNRDIFLEV